jgi:DNA-binding NarL/FixJ family response regulator
MQVQAEGSVAGDEGGPALGVLSGPEWKHVTSRFEFSPQQVRVVELIMESKADKQIAREMRVGVPTVRTYLTRIFQRTGATDRIGVVMRVFACVRELRQQAGGNSK